MKQKILSELSKGGIPDFSLFKSDESLKILAELLQDLLQVEKKNFDILVQKENESLIFDDFIQESQLEYLWSIINHINQIESNELLRKIISDFRPDFEDYLHQVDYSQALYQKILWFHTHKNLNADQKRRFELILKDYKRRGIDLPDEKQEALKELDKKLSVAGEKFQNNVVDDQARFSYYFSDDRALHELPKEYLEKMEKLAADKGGFAINADPTMISMILKYCSDSELRKTIYDQSVQRASKGEYDNRALALELLNLHQEKAKILGYDNAASCLLSDTMAQNPHQVFELLNPIAEKAKLKARKELEELKSYFHLTDLNPYDLAYYTRKCKEEQYALDEEILKQYFEFNAVLDRLHHFTTSFFGLELRKIEELSNADEMWYEVYQGDKQIAYYVLDPFYRQGKRPGARADILRKKSKEHLPIIVNVCNFSQGESGVSLLYLRDVETIFHEFGHALHAMLADSDIADLSGFNVERDFVELPSQLLENRVTDPDALKTLAKHYQTGESLPGNMVETLQKLKFFMKGNWVLRQNELGLLDITLYSSLIPKSVEELDQKILNIVNQHSLFHRGEEYKMYCAFLHIFGGSYEAKYYSYMRAELLEADVFSKIKEAGIFNPEIGREYREKLLEPGTRKPALNLFFDFMQREPNNQNLMKKYGLI